MITALVGYTGFVGSNLAASRKFDFLYNSKNIECAFGTKPELLVYAGVPAAKFLANSAPEEDRAICLKAFENICKIEPQSLVLISTVDVYQIPVNVDENINLECKDQAAYGKNRAELERLVHEKFPSALIIRLPALFGGGLKKNFLYDMITITPSMLKTEKYNELAEQSELVKNAYQDAQNGFYKLRELTRDEKSELREWFSKNSFNALSFTDSRAEYQFYNLSNLWHDITWANAANLKLVNFTSEPVSAYEIYEHVTKGGAFKNEIMQTPPKYDMKTKYFGLYSGENGYLYSKEQVLYDISEFMRVAAERE